MELRTYLEQVRPGLEEAFQSNLTGLLGHEDAGRNDLVPLLSGGKRVRGCLVCLAAEAVGGEREEAFPRAVAVELIHTASLIHDDFVDGDTMRRGRPALWTLRGARRAVLLGDLLFSSAIEMAWRLGREDGAVVSNAIAQMAKGAFQELADPAALAAELAEGGLPPGAYDKIIALKTGALFGAACQLGAISAGEGATLGRTLESFGRRTGEAYQMEDDLQELRQACAAGSVEPRRLAELTPALLRFSPGLSPMLVAVLVRGELVSDGELLPHLVEAKGELERELEARLIAAESELPAQLPGVPWAELMRAAPRQLIQVFRRA